MHIEGAEYGVSDTPAGEWTSCIAQILRSLSSIKKFSPPPTIYNRTWNCDYAECVAYEKSTEMPMIQLNCHVGNFKPFGRC